MKKTLLLLTLLSVVTAPGCRLFGNAHLDLSGTLEMTEHSVGTRLPGRLETVPVEEGQFVKKGELIATLDRYEQARKDTERLRRVFAEGGTDAQTLEHAELDLADQSVLSPVDGQVLVKVRQSGEITAAGAPVAVIGDTSKLWVRVFVPEGTVNRVRQGAAAVLRFDGSKKKIGGHVSYISPKAEFTPRNVQTAEERVTQTFAVKVMLDEPAPDLHAGTSCGVALELAER